MRAIADWISTNRLVTILLVGYFFLSFLVFEQGRTIENQRSLIQQLFGDSIALNMAKVHQIQQHRR
jgi:hypothetical protein